MCHDLKLLLFLRNEMTFIFYNFQSKISRLLY